MTQQNGIATFLSKQKQPKFRKLIQRKQQRPFKNEEIPIHKIRKDYLKFNV